MRAIQRAFAVVTVPVSKKDSEPPTWRLVEEAVVAKKLVVVASVPVALTKVKFCRVVEPTTRRSPVELIVVVAVPPMESELPWMRLAKREVEVACVVVERVMSLKMCVPVQVKLSDSSTENAPEEMFIPLPSVA